MEALTADTDSALGPMIDFRTLKAALWRGRRVWLVTGLLGLLIGASLHLAIPPKYVARTDLYLAQPANADPTQAMANDVSLLRTEAVAKQAVSSDHLHMSKSGLLSRYTGLALSNNIMSIVYSGTSQNEAVAGDRAVSRAFLFVLADQLRLQTDVLVRGMQSQINSLNASINDLNATIGSLSSAPSNGQTTNQITEFVNQRSFDATQVSQLEEQKQQALLSEQSVDDVSHVLDPAAVVPESTKKVIVKDGLSGLVAGLAVGLGAILLGALLSERARDRSTVAATVGAPVELSLGRYHSPRLMRRRRLARRLRTPSPALLMIERRLRARLESAPGSALAVITVGSTEPAALAVGALVLDLSSQGHRVVVVDAAADRLLASVLGLKSKLETTETFQVHILGSPPFTVMVAPGDPAQMAEKPPPEDADALLVLATLDPAFGAEHLAPWVTDAVLVLSATEVSVTRMGTVGEMLRQAGISLRSVILLGSDPGDDSPGAFGPVGLRGYARTRVATVESDR